MIIKSWDTETHPIQPGMLVPKAVVLSHHQEDMSGIDTEFPGLMLFPEALDWIEEQLLDPDVLLVAHNGAYDYAVCCAERPRLLRLFFDALEVGRLQDTMIIGKLVDIARGEHKFRTRDDGVRVKTLHALDAMAKVYLGLVLDKKDTYRVRYHELDGIPLRDWPEEAREYPRLDAKVAFDLYHAQQRYIKSSRLFPGYLPDLDWQLRAAWVLHLMSVWGITTDGVAVAKLRASLEKQLEGALPFMQKHDLVHNTGPKKDLTKAKWSKNTKEIKRRIEEGYAAQGKRLPLTDTGQTCTDADTKRDSGDPVLIKLASFGSAETTLKSFVPMLERGTETPITARWNVLVESGRISCSDPNLINPPAGDEGVRECYIPREGYAFGNADFSTVEMRAWAQIQLDIFGRSKLADVFRNGEDPHVNLLRAAGLPTDKDAHVEINGQKIPVRRYAKMKNFGFMSGLGAETFVEYAKGYGIVLTKQQAELERAQWFDTWTEAKPYFQWVSNQVPHDTATIKQLRSGRIRGGCHFTSAVNTQFQGLVADGSKRASWYISRECYLEWKSPLFQSRLSVCLYDEFIAEHPLKRNATAAVERMVELMKKGMQEVIPDVPIEVSPPILMACWSKDAKSKRTEDGDLIVWSQA